MPKTIDAPWALRKTEPMPDSTLTDAITDVLTSAEPQPDKNMHAIDTALELIVGVLSPHVIHSGEAVTALALVRQLRSTAAKALDTRTTQVRTAEMTQAMSRLRAASQPSEDENLATSSSVTEGAKHGTTEVSDETEATEKVVNPEYRHRFIDGANRLRAPARPARAPATRDELAKAMVDVDD